MRGADPRHIIAHLSVARADCVKTRFARYGATRSGRPLPTASETRSTSERVEWAFSRVYLVSDILPKAYHVPHVSNLDKPPPLPKRVNMHYDAVSDQCREFLEGKLRLTMNTEKTDITSVNDGFFSGSPDY